jgi:hypothetical protein
MSGAHSGLFGRRLLLAGALAAPLAGKASAQAPTRATDIIE